MGIWLTVVDLHPILIVLSHIGIDPVCYGSEQRCQTVNPLQQGQFPMQTYSVLGSNFSANQQSSLLTVWLVAFDFV